MPQRFADQVAFITGRADGFGLAFARSLGKRGASVALADVDGDTARRAAAELTDEGCRPMAVTCDVADLVVQPISPAV